jgi:hypothetical protein
VEVSHTDFTEVTRVVLVHVGAVVVLATGKTATTGMLPVLADTTMTGRDVATAVMNMLAIWVSCLVWPAGGTRAKLMLSNMIGVMNVLLAGLA